MKITIKQIEVFLAVAKTANITQAAATLHLTQSACSMALSALENQLDGVLFDRHGKKLVLNERGRMFFPKAADIIAQLNELQDLMTAKKKQLLAGHLMVGASTTIGNYLLPKVIADFVQEHTQTKVTLKIANTEQIIQKLLKFEIDVGMIEGNCYAEELEVTPWKKDELIVIASPKHALVKQKKVTLKNLCDAKWILREPGSGTREKFEEALNKIHGRIYPFLEFGNTEAIKQAVVTGLGVSCVSRVAVNDLIKSGLLVELKIPFIKLTRDFYILTHKEKYKTVLLNTFLAVSKNCVK